MTEGAQCHCTLMTPISVIVGHLSPDFESLHYSMRRLRISNKTNIRVTWSERSVMGYHGTVRYSTRGDGRGWNTTGLCGMGGHWPTLGSRPRTCRPGYGPCSWRRSTCRGPPRVWRTLLLLYSNSILWKLRKVVTRGNTAV